MPSNYTESLETQGAPSVIQPREYTSNADIIGGIGKAIGAWGADYEEKKSAGTLGNFSETLANIETDVVEYGQLQTELIAQMEKADIATQFRLREDIDKLRRGEVQGVLSPGQARMRINTLIKQYSVAHPALTKDFRNIADQATGNFRTVIAEMQESDPFIKKGLERVGAAMDKGISVPQAIERARVEDSVDADLKRYELQKATQTVNKEVASRTISRVSIQRTYLGVQDLLAALEQSMQNGVPTEDQVKVAFHNLEMGLRQADYDWISEQGADPNTGFAFGTDDYAAIDRPRDMVLSAFKEILLSGATLENKIKTAKMLLEDKDLTTVQNLWDGNPALYGLVTRSRAIFGPAESGKVIAGSISAQAQLERAVKADPKMRELLAKRAAVMEQNGNVMEALGTRLVLEGGIWSQVGNMALDFIAGKNQSTGTATFDQATKKLADEMYRNADTDAARRAMTPGMLESYTWPALTKNKLLQSDVAQSPELVAEAISKATSYVVDILPVVDPKEYANPLQHPDAIIFDANRGMNAFQYANNPISISKERTDNILRLNKTFVDILTMFGADAADQWVQALVTMGVNNGGTSSGTAGTLGVKKKVAPDVSPSQAEEKYGPIADQTESKYGLPKGILRRQIATESSWNPKAVGSVGELGLMQIRPEYHPDADPMNPEAAIDYGARFLMENYREFGSWPKALAAYNWGPDRMRKIANDPEWYLRIPDSTVNYIRKILG